MLRHVMIAGNLWYRKEQMANFTEVKDSGARQDFETGSRRDLQIGKARFDLIPAYVLLRLGIHYAAGAEKYGDHNWTKGQPISRYLSSCLRHIFYWILGLRDEDHLSAAIWNLMSIIDHLERIDAGDLSADLDDRNEWPKYRVKRIMELINDYHEAAITRSKKGDK